MRITPIAFAAVFAPLLAPGNAVGQAAIPAHVTLPSNPNAPVPAVLFRSVFRDTPKGVVSDTLDWKKANAEVGQFRRGHVDVLKWEENASTAKDGDKPPMIPAGAPKP